jgi:hypothetical protein
MGARWGEKFADTLHLEGLSRVAQIHACGCEMQAIYGWEYICIHVVDDLTSTCLKDPKAFFGVLMVPSTIAS